MFTHAYSFTIHLIKRISIYLKGWKIHIRIFGLLFQRFFFETIQNKTRSHTHEVASYVLKEMRLDLGMGAAPPQLEKNVISLFGIWKREFFSIFLIHFDFPQ